MAATVSRTIRLAVQDGSVVVQELRTVGQQGEEALKRIGTGAANANQALERTAETADRSGRQMRAAYQNVSAQAQDFVVQVQGGTDAMRAFSQQAPQALDAVAMAMGGLPPQIALTVTGLATLAALVPVFWQLVEGTDAATEATKNHKEAQDLLKGSIVDQVAKLEDLGRAYGLATGKARELQQVELEQALAAETKALQTQHAQVLGATAGLEAQAQRAGVAASLARGGGGLAAGLDQEAVGRAQQLQEVLKAIDQFRLDPKEGFGELATKLRELQDALPAAKAEIDPFLKAILDAAAPTKDAADNVQLLTFKLEQLKRVMQGLPALAVPPELEKLGDRVAALKKAETDAATEAKKTADEVASNAAANTKAMEQLGIAVGKTENSIQAAGEAAAASLKPGASDKMIADAAALGRVRQENIEFQAAEREANQASFTALQEEQAAHDKVFADAEKEMRAAVTAEIDRQAAATKRLAEEKARAHDQDVKTLADLERAVDKGDNPIQAAGEAAQARMSKFATSDELARAATAGRLAAENAEFTKAEAEADAALAEERTAAAAALGKANEVEEESVRLAGVYANWLQDKIITEGEYDRLLQERAAKEALLERQREVARRKQAIADALAEGPAGGVKAGLLQIQAQAEDSGQAIAQSMTTAFDSVTASMVDMLNGGEDAFSGLQAAALDLVKTIEQVIVRMLIVQAVEAAIGFGLGGGGATTGTVTSSGSSSATVVRSFHGGGVVGEGGGGSRSLPAWLFAGAPRAAGGLMLGPGEVPIVAHRGERVLSPEETRAYGRGGSVSITHAPTYNISGVTDVRMLQAVVEASSSKAQADLERRWRSDPMSRRATVGH